MPNDTTNLTEVDQHPSLSQGLFIRHKELWFTDGSVVLRAENVLFRVHMSQLSRRSLLFRDMFALPQGPCGDADKSIEGCPVIELHDSPEDLSNLLIALYDGPYVYSSKALIDCIH